MCKNVILILFFVTISYKIANSQEYMDDDNGKNVDYEAKALVSFVLIQIVSKYSIRKVRYFIRRTRNLPSKGRK